MAQEIKAYPPAGGLAAYAATTQHAGAPSLGLLLSPLIPWHAQQPWRQLSIAMPSRGTLMRHDLASRPVGARAPCMGNTPCTGTLIAMAGLAHTAPPGPLRAPRAAVHLTTVARRAHLHRLLAPGTDELPGAATHGVLLAQRGLDTTSNECNTTPRTRAQHVVGRGGDSLLKCWSPSRSFPLELRTIMAAIAQQP
jgi:hypothetical protein